MEPFTFASSSELRIGVAVKVWVAFAAVQHLQERVLMGV